MVQFCSCAGEAACESSKWGRQGGSHMWDWYSEHRSVPERHVFAVSLCASTDFS